MITFNVSSETPLTNSDNGFEIFVVEDLDGDNHGTYSSPERALQYIKDWLRGGEPTSQNHEPVIVMGSTGKVLVDDIHFYDIYPVSLRM